MASAIRSVSLLFLLLAVTYANAASISAEKFLEDLVDFLEKELQSDGQSGSNYVYYGKRADTDACDPNPCQNGARCSTAEQPLIGLGIGSECYCKSQTGSDGSSHKFGGYFCEIENPCDDCPANTNYCMPTNMDSDGKFCYDAAWNILDETASIPHK